MYNNRYGTISNINDNNIYEKIDKYTTRNKLIFNSDNYKLTRLNIDSRYREINPKNIIKNYIKLDDNPFIFEKNSYILKIKIPKNNDINLDNYISISNIKPIQLTLSSNNLILDKNSNLIQINHSRHNFEGDKNYIQIYNVGTNISSKFLCNIPISIINDIHKVILKIDNNIIDPNSYYIDIGIKANNHYIYNDIFNIDILTIQGINTKFILASYPINEHIRQGYHTVIDIENKINFDYIKIQLNDYATTSGIGGGNDISIGIIDNIINGYPNPNHYKFKFNKPFNKLRKIKLVNTIFPNSQFLINDKLNNKNNSLYWQILEDGEHIYIINIQDGNYNPTTLQHELTTNINSTIRKFGYYLNDNIYNYHPYCITKIILNNNIFQMELYSKVFLLNSISIDSDNYDDNYTRLTIIHNYHNLEIGDTIEIINSNNINDIPASVINGKHIVEYIYNINSYRIKLTRFEPAQDSISSNNMIQILYPIKFRLLFNYNDTIGNILGFNYVGNINSITKYKKIIKNNDIYDNSNLINSIGNINYNKPIFNFISVPYILMVSNIFDTNINIKDSIGIFAKILLPGNNGSYIFDQYIQLIENIPITYSNLYEIEFSFLTPDGELYDFNGIEHSYTLEFYEEIDNNNLNVSNL